MEEKPAEIMNPDVLDGRLTEPYRESPEREEDPNQHLPKQESIESTATSTGVPPMKVYKRRWYILILFSLLACHQCLIWNTWGPIATSVQVAYGWSDGTVAMMANWGTIMFVLSAVPLSWMVEAKGLRPTVLLVSFFCMFGSVIRCCRFLIKNPTVFLVASHLCSILNGISGVTIMAAPPIISSLWFPQNERTTATSINLAGNMLGNGLSMLIGPALVMVNSTNNNDYFRKNDYFNNDVYNTSTLFHYSTFGIQSTDIDSNRDKEEIKDDIDNYMIIDAGVAAGIFLLICVYFPSKPPLAPTPTSVIVRTDFKSGIKALLTNRDVLLTCFAYALSQGILGSWMGVMVLNLRPLGISDQQIGYIGLGSVLGQCSLSMITGYFTDWLKHKMKVTLLILMSIAGVLLFILTLFSLDVITASYPVLFITIVLATSLNFAACPLFFELCVEIAYPVSENLVGGFLTSIYNLFGIIFLFIFFIPNIGYVWINYVLVGSVVFALPAVVMIKERYNRSTVDDLVSSVTHSRMDQ